MEKDILSHPYYINFMILLCKVIVTLSLFIKDGKGILLVKVGSISKLKLLPPDVFL